MVGNIDEIVKSNYGASAVGSSFVVEDCKGHDIFVEFFRTREEAVWSAAREWQSMTRFDRSGGRVMSVYRIEWNDDGSYECSEHVWSSEEPLPCGRLVFETPAGLRLLDVTGYGGELWDAIAEYDSVNGTRWFWLLTEADFVEVDTRGEYRHLPEIEEKDLEGDE